MIALVRIFSLLFLLAAGPVRAGVEHVDDARLRVAIGAFCQLRSVAEQPAENTVAKKIDLLEYVPEIRWPTDVVAAAPGLSFGIVSRTVDGAVLDPVLIELMHPPFLKSGATYQSYSTRLGGEDPAINAYSFDVGEEMVPGSWTFRATHRGELLYEVRFEVVPAAMLPEMAGGCSQYLGS